MPRTKPKTAELPPTASPVRLARAADQIIDELRMQIATGQLALGARLPTERELAAQYGVSAPTMREALRALSSMGLVEVRHGSGAYVAATTDRTLNSTLGLLAQLQNVSVLEINDLLHALHLYAAGHAVVNASDEDIARVHEAAEATVRATSPDEIGVAVGKFLVSFTAAAHQPLLDGICGFLVDVIVKLELSVSPDSPRFWPRWAEETLESRIRIVTALEKRDETELRAALVSGYQLIRARITATSGLGDARMSDPEMAPLMAWVISGR